jgi:hypothetical protein
MTENAFATSRLAKLTAPSAYLVISRKRADVALWDAQAANTNIWSTAGRVHESDKGLRK